MTDEADQALPESGEFPASVAPEMESEVPDTSPDVAEESEQPETEQEKPKGGFQRRIAELVSERNDARRQLEMERRRIDQLFTMVARPQEEEATPAPSEPQLEDFAGDDGKYRAALIEYARAQARLEAREAIKAERAAQEQAARVSSFEAKEAEFAKNAPDYYDIVHDATLPITPVMGELIRESEVGAQLAYHLGKNRDLAQRLAGMNDRQVAREFGRLEASLTAPKAAPPKVSNAPPPPPKVAADEPDIPARTTDPSGDSLSDDEWFKAELKRLVRKPRK